MEPDCLVPGRTFPANPRFVVFRDNLPAAAFLELSSRTPSSSFQKQNLLFNSSHYSPGMHWPDPGIDMQRGGPEKTSQKSDLLLFFRCALHFWEVVKTSNSCHFSMQTTLEICWRHLNRQSLQRNQYQCDKNWNFKDQQTQSHFNWYHKVCGLRNIARQEATIRTCYCIALD